MTCTDDSNGGTFDLSLVVKDDDNGTSDASHATLSVANVNPTANAGTSYSGNEGSAIQLGGSGNDAGSNDVADLTYKWTVNTTGMDAGGACTFDDDTKKDAQGDLHRRQRRGHIHAQPGREGRRRRDQRREHREPDGKQCRADHVAHRPGDYSVWAITAPEFGSAGFVTASLADVGRNDTHTCKINWGDGDGEANGVVTETQGTGTGPVLPRPATRTPTTEPASTSSPSR